MLALVEQAIHVKIGILVEIGRVEVYLVFLLVLLIRFLLLLAFLCLAGLDHQTVRDVAASLPLRPSEDLGVAEEQSSGFRFSVLGQAIHMPGFILRQASA